MADNLIERVFAKRDKIAALPPDVRSAVINRLYDRVVAPKIPKGFGDDQKAALKTSFENRILGGSTQINLPPRESDRKAVGQETGFQGRFHAGFDAGLANVAKLLEGGTGVTLANKGEPPSSAQLEEKAKLGREATEAYAGRHPFKAGAAELVGQGLPAEPVMAAIPGGSLAANMVRGGIGMLPYDPSVGGAATGAAGAGLIHGAFAGLGRLAKGIPRPTGRAGTTNIPAPLAELASKTGKKFEDMSPDEKMKLIEEWKSKNAQASTDSVKAKAAAKQQALKDAEAARVKAASAKVDEKVATRRAMDEAKALQKRITAFVKMHKRAPNDQELAKLRSADPGMFPEEAAHVAKPTPQAESDLEAARRGAPGEPPKETLPPNEVPNAARASTQIAADQFKAANPEAIKAAQAVSEVAKQVAPPGQSGLTASEQKLMAKIDDAVTRMAEAKDPKVTAALQKTIANAKLGLQGNKEAMQRIADAERKAAERAKAVPAEETSASLETAKDTRPNPEQALLGKEEDFQKILTNLKGMGPKGEEAAKNIAMLVKAKRLTMEQLVQMLPKIEAGIKPKEGL